MVLNITDSQADYVDEVTASLKTAGVRVASDLRNEKVGFKIREHTMQKIPYLLVVGDREREAGSRCGESPKRWRRPWCTMSLAAFLSAPAKR